MLLAAGGLETALRAIGEDQTTAQRKTARRRPPYSRFVICDLDHVASVAARENVWFAVQPNAVH
jgi:hypothetical protein